MRVRLQHAARKSQPAVAGTCRVRVRSSRRSAGGLREAHTAAAGAGAAAGALTAANNEAAGITATTGIAAAAAAAGSAIFAAAAAAEGAQSAAAARLPCVRGWWRGRWRSAADVLGFRQ